MFQGEKLVGVCVCLNFHSGGPAKDYVQPSINRRTAGEVRGLADATRFTRTETPPATWKGQDITGAVAAAVEMGDRYTA